MCEGWIAKANELKTIDSVKNHDGTNIEINDTSRHPKNMETDPMGYPEHFGDNMTTNGMHLGRLGHKTGKNKRIRLTCSLVSVDRIESVDRHRWSI